MEVTHEWQDGPELLTSHLVSADVATELGFLEEILEEPEETGSAKYDDGRVRKSNRGVFFSRTFQENYMKCSPTVKVMKGFTDYCKDLNFTANSAFQSLYTIEHLDVLFSAYRHGDYYKPHRDHCKLTALYWVGDKDFDGGDLYLPDFDYTIQYEPSKLIMFPAHYQHEVTPISTDKEGFVRYCVSAFIY